MKSSLISSEKAKEHFIENYRFKVLGQEKKRRTPRIKNLILASKRVQI